MPLSLKEFDATHRAMLGSLSTRVLAVVEASSQAHTAEEVTCELLGLTLAGQQALMAPEIAQALPMLELILRQFAEAAKLRSVVRPSSGAHQIFYAKLAR